MQNEFEKQVQQKMEELKLVPSEPVWQKVEMQIRKKKDRRRVIFWVPLFVLLAGGLWIGLEYPKKISYSNETGNREKQAPSIPESTDKTIQRNNQTFSPDKKIENQNNSSVYGIPGKEINPRLTPAQEKTLKKTAGKKITAVESQTLPSKDEENIEADLSNKNSQQVIQNVNVLDTGRKVSLHTDTVNTKKEVTEIKTVLPESINQDSVATKKPEAKKPAVSKWKYNLVVAAGTSGLGRINVYGGQKSLNYTPVSSGGSANGGTQFNYGPSEVEKGFAFAFGGAAKKQLSKRTIFSAGLLYNYYSNTILVGSQVNQNRVIMDFAVSQFYSNQTTQAAPLQPYRNEYNFISLPIDISWQMLRKHPLNFTTGVSLQYLVQTNALRFDYNSQTYFHNIKAFNRTQLFSGFGLSYSVFLKEKPLTFGPELQYGLTRLEKENSENHLFSYGLKAQWQLSKN